MGKMKWAYSFWSTQILLWLNMSPTGLCVEKLVPAGDAILRGDRNFRRWSTAGGSGALRGVFKDYT
jgi:hypothetical protein